MPFDSVSASSTHGSVSHSATTSSSKVLIVDDDAGICDLLCSILESEGYEVMVAEDGEACLKIYSTFQPDLVLMDAIMPNMNGFECCRAIRAQLDVPQAQIVMLTSLDDEQAVNESTAAGASNYLTKPIRPAVLKQQLRLFLQQANTQRQLEATQQTLQQQLQQRGTQLEDVLTKLQAATTQTDEFEQTKTDLIRYLSHNLRNPLNAILAASALTQLHLPQIDDRSARHLHLIDKSVDAITDTLKLLDTFDQLTSTENQYYPASVNLTQLCQSLVEQWKTPLTSRHSLIFQHGGVAKPMVKVDILLIQQALNALISNAVRYSPEGGEIRVQLHWLSDSILLQVEDEGIGIPDAEQTQVFRPFYRASNADVIPGTPGLGLGLAISKQIATLHQGNITLKSELKRGTIVTIRLPHNSVMAQELTLNQ
jgi:hypothetical protein